MYQENEHPHLSLVQWDNSLSPGIIYRDRWERQHVSELQLLFPAMSHGTGLPSWGYFYARWFCLLSK